MAIVDRGSILLVVYSAFSAAVLGGLWQQLPPANLALLLAVCIGLLGVLMASPLPAAGCSASRGKTRSRSCSAARRRAWVSGLPLASILFPAASVGVLVVPLMLFHQVQLIACAVLARRYAASSQDAPNGHAMQAAE